MLCILVLELLCILVCKWVICGSFLWLLCSGKWCVLCVLLLVRRIVLSHNVATFDLLLIKSLIL